MDINPSLVERWTHAPMGEGGDRLGKAKGAGAGVDARDGDGWTAAMHAAEAGDLAGLVVLIGAGADIDAKNGSGWTAARWAAFNDELDCLRALLGAGCDVEARDSKGETMALRAAWMGLPGCLGLLIEAGCDLDARNMLGQGLEDLAELSGAAAGPEAMNACLGLILAAREKRDIAASIGAVHGPGAARRPKPL